MQLLQRFHQGVLVASFLTSLSASTHSDISVVKSFGKSLVVCSYQVAAPSQLRLPQHGLDAEDSGPLMDFRVRDPVLPSQLQYSVEAAEIEVIQLPGLVHTVAILHGDLQSAEGLTGIGDRVRPVDDFEETCISVLDDRTLVAQSKHGSSGKQNFYAFSRVFAPGTSQEFVFSETLLPCIERVLNGENALLFTYGVTSSGKTYTMQGDLADPGLLPRSLDIIFNSISSYSTLKYVVKPTGQNGFVLQSEAEAIMDRQRLDYTCNPRTPRPDSNTPSFDTRVRQTESVPLSKKSLYAVFVSFIELYNNNIYDLLAPTSSHGRSHNLREDGNRNIYVPGIVETEVKTADEALKQFYQGRKRRHVASTALNEASSRSHSIFTIRIVRTGYDPNYDEVIQDNSLLTVSQLCLVDLAGSERTSRSGTTGHRLKEASQINNSLMNLRRCIDVLRSNQMASPKEDRLGLGVSQTLPRKVPYRDTKLTHLFKSYFEGSGQVLVLICIRPKIEEYDETVTANDELLAATERSQALDKDLQVCVSKLLSAGCKLSSPSLSASEGFFNMPLICCPVFFDESDPDRDKSSDPESTVHAANRRRSSNAQKAHHLAHNCPLFEVLRARATERSRVRELLERLSQDLQSNLMNLVQPADAKSVQLTLLDSLNSMTVEKQRMESKIRYLENEVTKNRLLVRHEKTERLREADNARAQLQKLRHHVQDMTPNRQTPHARVLAASGRKRLSKRSEDAEENFAGDKRSRNEDSPPTEGRVAALSRRFESRLQDETGTTKRGGQTAISSTAPIVRLRNANLRRHTPTSPLADILNRPAAVNPRHRRSKSAGGGKTVWLEHKETFAAPLGTILTPSIKARKSATQVDLKDTLVATDYLLHHQTTDAEGNVETRLFKGSILPTAGGGSAVIFNDVEELRQKSPLRTSLRRSTRQSLKHSRTSQPPEGNRTDEDEIEPTPAKRPTSRGRRSKHSSLGSHSSAAVRSIGSASDLLEEDDGTSQASSYYPVNPPTKTSPPPAFETCCGIGISSGGGIGHSAGCRK
ncbi:unnamed protein product [Schistocephalus solidus]|uniref:Kinesin motor domain-containing protein n=1 Tax=Schistocephalus solidus TaxID=70667 RepID=A0A3P7DVJ3_SCHSO|nr:unnamed protein product [Schistocephalus solidus]